MNKKLPKRALIALFLALIYLPSLIGLVAGNRVKSENLENRRLTELPTPSLENLSELPEQYEAYYSDNQPFRDQLIYARALMNKGLYNMDVSEKVIFGKEDWLFYQAYDDGEPINNYRGEDLFTGLELRQAASSLVRARDDLKKIGCDFVLLIAPNKERVYSEFMPDRFGEPAENYAAKQLVTFLRQRTDLKVIYVYEEIMKAKADFPDIPIYYSKDTHWNHVGGYVATRALLEKLDIELPELTRDMIQPTGKKGPYDLAVLAHLTPLYEQDDDYGVTYDPEAVVNHCDKKLMYFRRDSFGGYMLPYMQPIFPGTIVDTELRDDAQVDELHPDVFVMELLERFVHRRLWATAVYAAPENRDKYRP